MGRPGFFDVGIRYRGSKRKIHCHFLVYLQSGRGHWVGGSTWNQLSQYGLFPCGVYRVAYSFVRPEPVSRVHTEVFHCSFLPVGATSRKWHICTSSPLALLINSGSAHQLDCLHHLDSYWFRYIHIHNRP